jgi:hypothetical protein
MVIVTGSGVTVGRTGASVVVEIDGAVTGRTVVGTGAACSMVVDVGAEVAGAKTVEAASGPMVEDEQAEAASATHTSTVLQTMPAKPLPITTSLCHALRHVLRQVRH